MSGPGKTGARIACAGTMLLLALAMPARGRVVDRVVAVVNGDAILLSEVEKVCQQALDEVPDSLPLDEAMTRKIEIRTQALDSLIDELLFKQQVREHKVAVTDEEVDQEVKRVMELNKLSEQQLLEVLKLHENKTMEQFKEERRKDMEQQKLIDLQLRNNPEIKGRLQVGDKDVEDAYRTEYQSVGSTEKIRASHILLAVPAGAPATDEAAIRAKAEKILAELRAGGSFEELAKKYSEDPSATMGGDLGFFRRGDMVPAFDQAAFALKKGEVSDLVRTPYGFHIITVTDRVVEGPRPLAEVSNEIRSRLQRERFQRVMQDWLADLRQHATISKKL